MGHGTLTISSSKHQIKPPNLKWYPQVSKLKAQTQLTKSNDGHHPSKESFTQSKKMTNEK